MNWPTILCAAFAGALAAGPVSVAQVQSARSPLPDLHLESVGLDEGGFLILRVANRGTGVVPEGTGGLQILVDGLDQGSLSFAELGTDAPRAPGASAEVRTRLRLSGTRRRVAVILDPENALQEENEFQKVFTYTLDAERVAAPTVVVNDIGISEEGVLFFTLVNAGNVDLPADVRLRARVILNDTWVASDFLVQTSGLRANMANRAVVFPTPPVAVVPPYSDFHIRVRSVDIPIDHTRAELRRRFPFKALEPYARLLADARIQQALTWQDASGARAHAQWPPAMKAELAKALVDLETDPAAAGRARLIEHNAHLMDSREARRVYVAYVAHALWLEARRLVSWRLASFEFEALRRLLDSRWLFSYNANADRYSLDGGRLRAHLSANPRVPYEFLRALLPVLREREAYPRAFSQPTFNQTVYDLTDWVRAHAVLDTSTARRTVPSVRKRTLTEAMFPERRRPIVVPDASSLRSLYAGILRALNIPMDDTGGPERLQFLVGKLSDLALIDAGIVLDPVFAPSGDAVPATRIFMRDVELEPLFLRPKIECVGSGRKRCNSLAKQRAFNLRRHVIASIQSSLPDFVLRLRCNGTAEHLEAMLTGDYAGPFLNPDTRAAVGAAIESGLRAEGSGDRAAGCLRVEERWQRYLAGR